MVEKNLLFQTLLEQADFLGVKTYVVDGDSQLNLTLSEVIAEKDFNGKKICILNSEHYDANQLRVYLNSRNIDVFLIDNNEDYAKTLNTIKEVEVGITPADLLVAETCTLVIRNKRPFLRELSLLPPIHIAIIGEDQIIADLYKAVEILKSDIMKGDGITLITGPSKTADIELNLVKGVHGPKEVILFIVRKHFNQKI